MELGIYNAQMLRLAAEAGAGRLAERDASAEIVNPVCGDRIRVDIRTDGARIAALGYEVHACVLTQASASLLGRHAVERTAAEIRDAAERIEAMLRADGGARQAATGRITRRSSRCGRTAAGTNASCCLCGRCLRRSTAVNRQIADRRIGAAQAVGVPPHRHPVKPPAQAVVDGERAGERLRRCQAAPSAPRPPAASP